MTDIIFGKEYIVKVTDDGECITVGELVRCKDCKHYKKEIKCVGGHYSGCDEWIDEGCEIPVDEDGYCSYAERKDNG